MFAMFSSRAAQTFARELAASILQDLGTAAARQPAPKFRGKADKALQRAQRRIDAFKTANRLNWWQRSRAANAFLWTLKEAQCAQADELTEWFVLHV